MNGYTYRVTFDDDLSGTLEYGSYIPDDLPTENTAPEILIEEDGSVVEGPEVTTTIEYAYEPGTFVPSNHLWFPPYRFANTSSRYLEAFEDQEAATAYLEDNLYTLYSDACPYLDPATLEPTVPAVPFVIRETAEVNRKKRAMLLFESDWTQTTDSVLSDADQTAWRSYRQELRDITSLTPWPFLSEDDWPTAP
jgi:hypothetical protein